MSRKYGKGKSYGGAGLQFDKLLKACSNSKKPSVTKTSGALGHFGITSFTSTRNSGCDVDSCEDESRFKVYKRPRFDVEMNLAAIRNDSFHYSENLMMPSPTVDLQSQPLPPVAIKPKKFFKSRNTEGDQSSEVTIISQTKPTAPVYLPPLPMPITIPNPNIRHQKKNKSAEKKKTKRRKESTSSCDSELKAFHNATNMSPPAEEEKNKTSTSPSIKLRIFKDKKTSKFVSVSDTSLPPKLERQVQDDENEMEVHLNKRAHKPKAGNEEVTSKVKVGEKDTEVTIVVPRRRSGRLTRSSRRLRNSDSIGEMPILTAAEGLSEAELERFHNITSPPQEDADHIQKVDSAEKLVQRLEEEDSEFRELTAMLSSMEGSSENCHQDSGSSGLTQESPLNEFQQTLPFQPSPINYSTNAASESQSEYEQPPPAHSVTDFERPNSSEEPARDFRTMLEDEWGDESYEDESPRKSNSPNKVSRFDMPEFMVDRRHLQTESMFQNEIHQDLQSTTSIVPLQIPQLNSSYAVRNLLSGITGNDDLGTLPLASFEASQLELAEGHVDEQIPLPLTPEKVNSVKDPSSAVKKASIFKSRVTAATNLVGQPPNPKKRLALYRHKFGQETTEKMDPSNPLLEMKSAEGFEVYVDTSQPLSLHRRKQMDGDGNVAADGTTKVYCSQETKKLFTVIRNVKAIHELQESGEVHEFDGDIWYILEDLKESNPISSRCLSAITLAMRCMEPAFRMHLRAHGTVAEFSRELHDAPNIPVLALAAATVLFVLSQDRLNMDLDTESFQLILSLAKTEQKPQLLDENPELSKHKQRIIDLVTEMKNRGHAKHIKIEKITASELALETLLFLTSKRAGEWVKRELRTLGGLDYIVTEVDKAVSSLELYVEENGWSEVSTEILWKIDRCLKVLQQVTFNHEENQKYLLGCENQIFDLPSPQHSPQVFVHLFQFLSQHLSRDDKDPDNFIILREILFSVLRVLVNLTHDYRGIVLGSEILSSHVGFLQLTLHSIFTLSTAFLDGKCFDLLMHSLCMLLNIVEHSQTNRNLVLSMSVQIPGKNTDECISQSTLDALIHMFFEKESEAKKEEASTDYILTNSTDSQSSESQNCSQESKDNESSSVQDIIDKLIETAGKHMENSMIGAHISLLIAYLVMDNADSTAYVQNAMPNSKFLPLMILLKKLFNFMSITTSTSGSTRGLKATSVALKFFEKCDPDSAAELKNIIPD